MRNIAAYALLLSCAAIAQGTNYSPIHSTSEASVQSAEEDQGTGILKLTSTPSDANVAIDGNNVGVTPLSIDLAAGNHSLLVTKAGYQPWKAEVQIESGTQTGLGALLKKSH